MEAHILEVGANKDLRTGEFHYSLTLEVNCQGEPVQFISSVPPDVGEYLFAAGAPQSVPLSLHGGITEEQLMHPEEQGAVSMGMSVPPSMTPEGDAPPEDEADFDDGYCGVPGLGGMGEGDEEEVEG
jgi:hypothetical protein